MNIFVAKLSARTSGEDLEQVFSEFGEVSSAKVIMDRETGSSKRFGFVEMEDNGAQEAIDALNGSEHGGRSLKVNEARPRERRPRY